MFPIEYKFFLTPYFYRFDLQCIWIFSQKLFRDKSIYNSVRLLQKLGRLFMAIPTYLWKLSRQIIKCINCPKHLKPIPKKYLNFFLSNISYNEIFLNLDISRYLRHRNYYIYRCGIFMGTLYHKLLTILPIFISIT